jgi:geranylgeranyl diphosphate synthase type I
MTVPTHFADAVEDLLQAALDRLSEPGRSGSRRIVAAGGKRLRPELLLRCASLGGGDGPGGLDTDPSHRAATLSAAAAVELLHSATLLHDDLLDGSDTRRGVAAVHRAEGLLTAVIAGDALIAQSWRMIARSGPDDAEDLADALADMCSGEELEAALAFDPAARPLDVLRVAQLKTGALLRAACRIGGRRAGLGEAQVRALGAYGSDFGVALQLVDDVLDVASEPALLGKPCGADFVAGTVTMPTVYAIADGARTAELLDLLRPGLDGAGADHARALVLAAGGAERTAELARSFARRAAKAMMSVTTSTPTAGSPAGQEAARALAALPMFYVDAQLEAKVAARVELLAPRTSSEDVALLAGLDGHGSAAG